MKKSYIPEAAIARSIACILVMVVHITADPSFYLPMGTASSTVFIVINRIAACTVPVFICLSGFTLIHRYGTNQGNQITFLTKRFLKTGIPYIMFCLIYYFLLVHLKVYDFSITGLIKGILTGNILYHLYFIIVIFQFYLLFFAYRYLMSKIPLLPLTLTVFAFNVLFIQTIHSPYSHILFCFYMFYFALGCATGAHYNDKIKNRLISHRIYFLLIAGIAAILLCRASLTHPQNTDFLILRFTYASTAIPVIAILSMKIAANNGFLKSLLLRMDPRTYFIYLAHPLVILFVDFAIKPTNQISRFAWNSPLMICFVAIICSLPPKQIKKHSAHPKKLH